MERAADALDMTPVTPRQEQTARLAAHLEQLEGVAHIQSLLARGYTRQQVAFLFRAGLLKRPRVGWYCSPDLPADALRAIRVGGVLGCTSAAASYGIAVPPGASKIEVSVAPDATRLRASTDSRVRVPAGVDPTVNLHWHPRIEPVRGWRVSPTDALLQMSSCVPNDWLTAAIDSARRPVAGGVAPLTPGAFGRLRDALPVRARSAADASTGLPESVPETLVHLGLRRAGVPFEAQVWLLAHIRVDLLIDTWLVIEVDGAAFHSGRDAFAADRERDAELARRGYRVFRVSYRQVVDDWPAVLRAIQQIRLERR